MSQPHGVYIKTFLCCWCITWQSAGLFAVLAYYSERLVVPDPMSPPSSSTENGGFKFVKYFNLRLAYSCSIIALSQINFGLEQGVFTNTQAMDAFVRKFGVYNAQTKK